MGRDSLETIRLRETDPDAWGLMPTLLRRIQDFVRLYDPDRVPGELARWVRVHFATDSDRLGLWAIRREGEVVGHVLASIEEAPVHLATPDPLAVADASIRRWVFVGQAEFDRRAGSRSERIRVRHSILEELDQWGRAWDCTYLEMGTQHPVRFWEPFGFHFHRTVLRRPL